jgi:hypothetical protein
MLILIPEKDIQKIVPLELVNLAFVVNLESKLEWKRIEFLMYMMLTLIVTCSVYDYKLIHSGRLTIIFELDKLVVNDS